MVTVLQYYIIYPCSKSSAVWRIYYTNNSVLWRRLFEAGKLR